MAASLLSGRMVITRLSLILSLSAGLVAQFAPVSSRLIESGVAGGPVLDNGDRFGRSAVGIGDLDRDGIPDVVAGTTQLLDFASNAVSVTLR